MADVRHDEMAHRFTSQLGGETAQLDYELDRQRMSITHTRVPPAFRGRGVAADLMQAALSYARQRGFEVVPVCSYAVAYLERHAIGGRQHREDMLDEALDESYPASDPPAVGDVS